MMEKIKAWYNGLQSREQRMVSIGGIALAVIILVGGILWPLHSLVSEAVEAKDTKQADLEWMRQNGPEIRAGSGMLAPNTNEPPVVLVDRVARESGLGTMLRGTQPNATGVRVQQEAAPFDTVVTWLATLEARYGLAIDSITVDRGQRQGLVNANITFSQAKH
jgi:general secretion pathway protein M